MLDEKGEHVTGRREACRLFDAQVADYLEGGDRPAVIAHAGECAFCSVILADLRAVISESAALGFEEPPPVCGPISAPRSRLKECSASRAAGGRAGFPTLRPCPARRPLESWLRW